MLQKLSFAELNKNQPRAAAECHGRGKKKLWQAKG